MALSIVFVHGLGASAGYDTTWTDRGVFWPQNLLPLYPGLDKSSIRVLSFSYNTDPTLFLTKIDAYARRLLTDMYQKRQGSGDALIISRNHANDSSPSNLATIAPITIGAVFLGTPQRFVSTIGWQDTTDKLAEMVATPTTRPSVVSAFNSGFYQLAKLENDFNSGMVEDLAMFSFYEGVKTTTLVAGSDYIVGQFEATTGTKDEHPNELNKDYQSMSKFNNLQDDDYDLVASAILEILNDYENDRGPAVEVINTIKPYQPDPRFPDYQNGLGPSFPFNRAIPGQIVQTKIFGTGNICGDPSCGRTHICAADYNRRIQPTGAPGV